MEIIINPQFKLKDFELGVGIIRGAFGEHFETDDWIDVPVPGGIYQALYAAGRIPDQFHNWNELDCARSGDREY